MFKIYFATAFPVSLGVRNISLRLCPWKILLTPIETGACLKWNLKQFTLTIYVNTLQISGYLFCYASKYLLCTLAPPIRCCSFYSEVECHLNTSALDTAVWQTDTAVRWCIFYSTVGRASMEINTYHVMRFGSITFRVSKLRGNK